MRLKEWKYLVEELKGNNDSEAVQEQLAELGSLGWEAVTSWTILGDKSINHGAPIVYILFKMPDEDSN